MNSQQIIGCLDPTLPQGVATKNYVDLKQPNTLSLATDTLDMNTQIVSNAGDATAQQDLITKK